MKGLFLAGVALVLAGCALTPGVRDRSEVVAEPSVCAPQRFEVYFGDSEARLTDAARHAIGLTATQLQGCEIRKVNVVGLTDARGGAVANLDLSERRALAGVQPDRRRRVGVGDRRRGQRTDAAPDRGAGRRRPPMSPDG